MNGQRSSSRQTATPTTGSSSLDALSRTIEGLEARIEGLMSGLGRDGRDGRPGDRPIPTREPLETAAAEPGMARAAAGRFDPLAEIRARQKALQAARPRPAEAGGPSMPDAMPAANPDQPRGGSDPTMDRAAGNDLHRALESMRQELNRDFGSSLAREINALRAEIRDIRSLAESSHDLGDLRADLRADLQADLGRMADSIERLGRQAMPEAEALRTDFASLRSLIDGLARQDDVKAMDIRWSQLETRFDGFDPQGVQRDLVSVAGRLDEIKHQLSTIGDARSVRLLEDKLLAIAAALEQVSDHIEPNTQAVADQFSQLDQRLDEISRAIAVTTSRMAAPAADPRLVERLEERIAAISTQIEDIARQAADPQRDRALAGRIDDLSRRIETLADAAPTRRLEDRLDRLADLLEQSRSAPIEPELTGYLSDISRKIDALDHSALNDRLLDQLADITRRIDEVQAPAVDDRLLRGLDERLHAIASRLDETAATPSVDTAAIANLEQQIAHLSALISSSSLGDSDISGRLDQKMAAFDDYLATSDEFVVEAARQAAEAVMDAYIRQGGGAAATAGQDQTAESLGILAQHLRHLEDISRGGEERNHRTFEALHETLVQIAEKLDQIDRRSTSLQPPVAGAAAVAPLPSATPMPSAASVASAAPAASMVAAAPAARPSESLADSVSPMALAAASAPTTSGSAAQAVADQRSAAAELAPVEAPVAAGRPGAGAAAGRPSLLAGLGKRLTGRGEKPSAPPAGAAATPAQADPAASSVGRSVLPNPPSIDPVDVLPPDEANELLEPGSGTPDVRLILEKVRARQAAEAGRDPAVQADDRMDFIAAARRAAQAAAQETDRRKGASRIPLAAQVTGGSSFARYRRPILMAVGAVLLVALSLPLVRSLTSSDGTAPAPMSQSSDAPVMVPAPPPTFDPAPAPAATSAPAAVNGAGETTPSTPDQAPLAPASSGGAATAPGNPATALPAPQMQTGPAAATPPAPAPGLSESGPDNPPAPLLETPAPAKGQLEAPATVPGASLAPVPADLTPASLATAARNGDAAAWFEIGSRYMEGRGVTADFAKAAVWYQQAADKGLAPAQYRLAGLYDKGTGVARDIAKARDLYLKAADAGNAGAMHNLAVHYASGAEGKPDLAEAAKWFTRAAELGIADSQYNLAVLYARGSGVQPDLAASYQWFALAAKAGDQDAAAKRDEVGKALKPDALARVKALVEQWQARPLNPDANSVPMPEDWQGKALKTGSVDMTKAVRNIQVILNRNGFDAGEPDGKLGTKTVAAIKAFQTSVGQEATGKVSNDLVKALLERNR